MRTFPQKTRATPHTPHAGAMRPGRAHSAQNQETDSIIRAQRAIGNRAVQRLLQASTGNVNGRSATVAESREPKEAGTPAIHGGHRALSSPDRSFFEPLFGHDLSQVRIHTGARSAATADALNADAFTVGRDIHFGPGRYQPGSPAGRRLLAHELAHTVQQPARPFTAAPLAVSQPGDRAEREADRAAGAVLAGRPAHVVPGSEPRAIHRQPKQPKRADRFLPAEKTTLRKLGRGDLNELIDQIIADGKFHQVRQETIEGVEHTWEVKTEIVELSEREQLEGARFGGAVGAEETVTEAAGKKVRHRMTYILRGGRASTIESALHELIHLRIMMDRRLPEEKRSSFYDEYAQLTEMTEVLAGASFAREDTLKQKSSYGALPLVTGDWDKLRIVLNKMAAIRGFFVAQDANAAAAFDKDTELTPAALMEFITQEKYVTQTAARAASGNAPGNETVATRYARAVAGKFEGHLSEQARTRISTSSVGSKQKNDLVDGLRSSIQRLYDALDKSLREARELEKNPPSPPANMPDPLIFQSRPLGIGGAPIPPG